ncbi:MAG: acyl carrier protein [Candidatus Latescibacterota bacterium]|jgi:acyl carrier protein
MSTNRTRDEIEGWLSAYMSEALKIDKAEIDWKKPLQDYGLDSSAAVILLGDLEDFLDAELDPTLLVDHKNLDSLINHLCK